MYCIAELFHGQTKGSWILTVSCNIEKAGYVCAMCAYVGEYSMSYLFYSIRIPHMSNVWENFGKGSSFVKEGKKFLLLLLVLIFARDPILIALIVSRQCCMNEGELWLSLHIQLMEDKNGRQKNGESAERKGVSEREGQSSIWGCQLSRRCWTESKLPCNVFVESFI